MFIKLDDIYALEAFLLGMALDLGVYRKAQRAIDE